MATGNTTRRISAILKADAVGYSRLMGADEATTIDRISSYRELFAARIKEHNGRLVDSPGDEVLAEFPTALDATRCAAELQQAIKNRSIDLPKVDRMEFRIGIHMGDVTADGNRLYGDTVNIASRLEELSDPGGIFVSSAVHDQVHRKLDLSSERIGEKKVKNISKPVLVYRVFQEPKSIPPRILRIATYASAAVVLLCFVSASTWYYFRQDRVSSDPIAASNATTGSGQATQYQAEKPSIAVLPFDNMSRDPEQGYFADGITEETITRLSKSPELLVISRNSMFTYKGKPVNSRQVAQELGVRYVLEGSVQKAGDRVRVTAQLIDGLTDGHLWADTYDRELSDIFAIRDEIAQRIASAFSVTYVETEMGRVKEITGDELTSREYYWRGLEHFYRRKEKDRARAREFFRKAIKLNPDFAEAYSRIGFTHYWDATLGTNPDFEGGTAKAIDVAKKAIAIDGTNSTAYALLAEIYAVSDPAQALIAANRAISLDPNNAEAYFGLGYISYWSGKAEKAIQEFGTAIRLNPNYARYIQHLGSAQAYLGRFDNAIAASKTAHSLNYEYAGPHLQLSQVYIWQWKTQRTQDPQTLDRALEHAQEGIKLENSSAWGRSLLGLVHLYRKQLDKALEHGEETISMGHNHPVANLLVGHILYAAGRPQEAIALIGKVESLGMRNWISAASRNLLGKAYRLSGSPDHAMTQLEQALGGNPPFECAFDSHLELSILHSELGHHEEAEAEAAEVLKLVPSFSVDIWGERNPMKDRDQVERDMDALRKAGLG